MTGGTFFIPAGGRYTRSPSTHKFDTLSACCGIGDGGGNLVFGTVRRPEKGE